MSDEDRAAFVEALSDTATPSVGVVVLGGLFAESVDFEGGALRGVVVVGPGLPPRSTERDLVAERFGDDGFTVAYLQPALAKVVQAAGRALRGRRTGAWWCSSTPGSPSRAARRSSRPTGVPSAYGRLRSGQR